MAPVFIRQGRAHIRLDMPTAAQLEAEVRRLLGPSVDVAEAEVQRVHQAMLETWPVKTGKTRRSFERYLLLDPVRYRAEVGLRSDVPAVRFVKSTKEGRKRDQTRLRFPLQTDVRRPIIDAKKKVQVQLRALLKLHLQGVFRG